METHATPPLEDRRDGRLIEPPPAEQRDAVRQWRQLAGERITRLDQPDDAIAFKLIDAAGEAIARRQVQAGVEILETVVKHFGESQEAALARQALDQIRKQASRQR